MRTEPKLLIVVLFQNLGESRPYYARPPTPPLSGALLAALTPPEVEQRIQDLFVRPPDALFESKLFLALYPGSILLNKVTAGSIQLSFSLS